MTYLAPELRSWSALHLRQLLLLQSTGPGLLNTVSLHSPCRSSSFFFTMALRRKGTVLSSLSTTVSSGCRKTSISVM